MTPRGRFVVPVLVALVLVVASTVVLVGVDRLERRLDVVHERWMPLRVPLDVRYEKLAAMTAVYRDANGGSDPAEREIAALLERWDDQQRARRVAVEREAATADALEKAARRLTVVVFRDDRLRGASQLASAIETFKRSEVPFDAIQAYNHAIVDYESTRDSPLGAPSAHLLGYYGRSGLGLTV